MSLSVFLLLLQCILFLATSQTMINGSNITCHGANACQNKILACDHNMDCNITCSGGDSACKLATILCPTNGNCIINCEPYPNICAEIKIYAKTSTSLTWNCPDAYKACDQFRLECPVNGHLGPIQCRITGVTQNAINVNSNQVSDIYVVEGFNDVNITGTDIGSVRMYCDENYLTQCSVGTLPPFTCGPCSNIQSPSQYPTKSPSNNPTTSPITATPTTEPTVEPSINPTISPSTNPTENTLNPTKNPSISPTTEPTNNPSANPTFPEGPNVVETSTTALTTNTGDTAPVDGDGNDNVSAEIDVVIALLVILIVMVIVIASVCFILMKRRENEDKKRDKMEMIRSTSPSNGTDVIRTDINGTDINEEEEQNEFLGSEPGSIDVIPQNDVNSDENDENDEEEQDINKKDGFYCRAITDYVDVDEDQLNLTEGGIYYIMETTDGGWWYGIDENGLDGWMPSNYLHRFSKKEEEELKQQQKEKTDGEETYNALLTELMEESYNNIINNNIIQQNIDKYMNMPPKVPQVTLVTAEGDSDASSSSDDELDIDQQTVGKITNNSIVKMESV